MLAKQQSLIDEIKEYKEAKETFIVGKEKYMESKGEMKVRPEQVGDLIKQYDKIERDWVERAKKLDEGERALIEREAAVAEREGGSYHAGNGSGNEARLKSEIKRLREDNRKLGRTRHNVGTYPPPW